MYYQIKKKIRKLTYSSQKLKYLYSSLNNFKTQSLNIFNDEVFAKIKYWEATGQRLNIENPKYFNEKLWWLKINYRHSLMTECSDKVRVRDYIARIGLGKLLTDIYGVYDKAEEVPFKDMKGKYFIKCNHVSGINRIFDSENESNFDIREFEKTFNKALKMNYYYQSREWNYKNIEPKIIVENFIESQSALLDYRFFCFHGEVKLIFVDIDTAAIDGSHNPSAKRNIYDRKFNLQNFTVGRENFDNELVKKPENLELMIEYAEKISSPFPFCRVDLYNNNGEIKFGEITFFPGGATQQFSTDESDRMVSSWLRVK
ncbi:carboxylate--amine ligase [Psychrobacter sp. C 20.9]|uniref:ATP-grasp fold amidoligase family protein n=1 Tax=Psychrobacter sp. C 20.9 TaxID=1926477 RepID=UPI0009469E75|nr:ATP-grasp fold amidoligase family protein [Psychrobacter sp. C 20.9]OLF37264.1 carboxylate--amine ligase [Psychrobacter sp. C 20.9]